MAEYKFEVWDIDHGHIENHANFCGEATTAEEAGALVTKAIKGYPIFTSDEIVVHTIYSSADGGGNGESHMFDDDNEGMPEGDPIVSENMPEGGPVHHGYNVTIEREVITGVVSTTTFNLPNDFLYAMYKRNRMGDDMSAKGFRSIRIEKGV